MTASTRRVILPTFSVTEIAEEPDSTTTTIPLVDGSYYHVRPKFIDGESSRVDGKPRWVRAQFDRFPIVIKGTGEPWDEANVWILSQLEGKPYPNIDTFIGMAEDISAYWKYLEDNSYDWMHFPSFKLRRPTYRYSAHLKGQIQLGEIAPTTAKRRMSRVVNFYRWLMQQKFFNPENSPWVEGEVYVPITDAHGDRLDIKITTTDVGIKVTKENDPFDETIPDGGKLRPLPQQEQEWLFEALNALNHPEITLAHMVALSTGARIQTVLTMKLRHFSTEINGEQAIRIPIGPGTGIDTKGNYKMTLQVPAWLYKELYTYGVSERARKRRLKAVGGDYLGQYIFLSSHSVPYYTNREYEDDRVRRHSKKGQSVRQYIKTYIIPYIKNKRCSTFNYQFHDLRATFGMNLVDACADGINDGKFTYTEVLNMLAGRLGHKSMIITERYLKYRGRIKLANTAQDNWEENLITITRQAMQKVTND
jgi:integrase